MRFPSTKNLFRLTGLIICLLGSVTAKGQNGSAEYLTQLLEQAQHQRLAEHPHWLKLLHYKPAWLSDYKSQVDAPRFFNAADGKTNPEAELIATLQAFFSDFPEDKEAQHIHPYCVFVARRQWLGQKLNFDQRMPHHTCERFQEWLEALNPAGMTLIFPTSYINSPASMFGHTLVRVDAKDQTEETRLLSYAFNFGADTGSDGGLAYAFKGLLGGYPGSFSVLPYYLKVREYSDMENREIWEYKLKLSEAETQAVLRHAWELRGIWFNYFFFDENCSYHLLSLLETAREELFLTDHFSGWTIPSDTVRVLEQSGLIGNITYRPSRAGQLRHRLAPLNKPEIAQIRDLASGALSADDNTFRALPSAAQARQLEIAAEYAAYQADAETSLEHALLQARSQVDYSSPAIAYPGPAFRPEQGHPTARLNLSLGRSDDNAYQQLEIRPSYHDLLDPSPGYGQGAQIAFFELALRHEQGNRTRLERFTPIDIFSLTPVSEIALPTSWRFNLSLRHKHGISDRRLLTSASAGAGLSWQALSDTLLYALADTGLDIGDDLDKGYALGIGGRAGIISHISANWALHLYGEHLYYREGHRHHEKKSRLEIRYSLNTQHALRLQHSYQQQLAAPYHETALSWQHYF